MAAKATRLEAHLKFHNVEVKKLHHLKKQGDEFKKMLMEKELASTQSELKAVDKFEQELIGEFTFLMRRPCLKTIVLRTTYKGTYGLFLQRLAPT